MLSEFGVLEKILEEMWLKFVFFFLAKIYLDFNAFFFNIKH